MRDDVLHCNIVPHWLGAYIKQSLGHVCKMVLRCVFPSWPCHACIQDIIKELVELIGQFWKTYILYRLDIPQFFIKIYQLSFLMLRHESCPNFCGYSCLDSGLTFSDDTMDICLKMNVLHLIYIHSVTFYSRLNILKLTFLWTPEWVNFLKKNVYLILILIPDVISHCTVTFTIAQVAQHLSQRTSQLNLTFSTNIVSIYTCYVNHEKISVDSSIFWGYIHFV